MAHRDNPLYRAVDAGLRQVLRRIPPSRRAEHLALWWGNRFQAGPTTIRLRNGCRMRVEPRDYLLTSLYYLGTFEPHCMRLLPRLLPRGGTMVDIGANIGVYTLTAANLVGAGGRVVAIEPMPAHAAALRDHVALNELPWVTVVETAVGAHDGQALLSLPARGNSGMFTLGGVGASQEGHRVSVASLDRILEQVGVDRVDLVKMDIEGSETEALRGAAGVLGGFRPTFLIELNERALRDCGGSSEQIVTIFREACYTGWAIDSKGLRPLGRLSEGDCIECLFTPEGAEKIVH